MRPAFLSLCLAAGIAFAAGPSVSHAQTYPDRPVKFVVPVPPGGGGDFVARLVGNAAAADLGQQLVVENRAGATGNIGTAAAVKQPADGYTVLLCSIGNCSVNSSLYKNPGFDLFKDIAPVVLLGSSINVLTVGNGTSIHSVKELLEQAKTGKLAYGSSGVGASNHLAAELLKKLTGAEMVHVPYKGSGPAITDLLGGQIQVFFDNEPSILPFIKSGKVRALAVTGKKRSANLPDVPTMEELGLPIVIEPWYAIGAPAKTPPAAIARLNAAFNRGLQQESVRKSLIDAGITPAGGTPAAMGQHMRKEYERWGELIRSQNIVAD
ncbi:MAG: tripartite tricarboxylate transporter substrate binding protein [Rubrivivax sp.]